MPYAIFSVKKENIGKIDMALKDDLVSRQSITVRDASVLGISKEVRLVLVEGTEEAIRKADELFKPIGTREPEEEAKAIYAKFKEEDSNVASGMGMVFG